MILWRYDGALFFLFSFYYYFVFVFVVEKCVFHLKLTTTTIVTLPSLSTVSLSTVSTESHEFHESTTVSIDDNDFLDSSTVITTAFTTKIIPTAFPTQIITTAFPTLTTFATVSSTLLIIPSHTGHDDLIDRMDNPIARHSIFTEISLIITQDDIVIPGTPRFVRITRVDLIFERCRRIEWLTNAGKFLYSSGTSITPSDLKSTTRSSTYRSCSGSAKIGNTCPLHRALTFTTRKIFQQFWFRKNVSLENGCELSGSKTSGILNHKCSISRGKESDSCASVVEKIFDL
mmetsp:Transcript_22450/g.25260  ORF Transcript_22450/g.25260 Transcript_22450/m.25260 type:complete len:288 (+) Transcript_22450:321-1184(+)